MSTTRTCLTLSDKDVLVFIKGIITERPTYGYRRICSLLNHRIGPEHKVNHKRIYRIMKENSLLHLPFGKRAVRAHEGKIITLYSKS